MQFILRNIHLNWAEIPDNSQTHCIAHRIAINRQIRALNSWDKYNNWGTTVLAISQHFLKNTHLQSILKLHSFIFTYLNVQSSENSIANIFHVYSN